MTTAVSTPPATDPAAPAWRWDIFCRVIDNHGDLGVCWRLSADLGARGHRVRLWVDEPAALVWMAPDVSPGVTVERWREPSAAEFPGDVVVEAFGCDPPAAFVARMAQAPVPPVWINLEYLSAEPYVERSHGLQSPQFRGPGAGLSKWFFYPGFTPATGGLLRGADLALPKRRRTDTDTLTITLFSYAQAALPSLLQALSALPPDGPPGLPRQACLRVTPGWATQEVGRLLDLARTPLPGTHLTRGTLNLEFVAPVSQPHFDTMLRNADLNLVRGEDSLVRAIWAGRPFLWQVYPQDDGAHAAKLGAFLDTCMADDPPPDARHPHDGQADEWADERANCLAVWRAWNGLAAPPTTAQWHAVLRLLPTTWAHRASRLHETLRAQPDLVSQLIDFVSERRHRRDRSTNG
jgi:uncharacterized repeat protein (TIGR03837 family)